MESEGAYGEDSVVEVIPLHFDVPQHHIPLDDFIQTAKKTEAILDGFNNRLFDGKLKYKMLVVPPKDGGFIEILGYIGTASVGSLGLVWAYSQTKDGKAFFESLTGHKPTYWHKRAGEKLRALLAKKKTDSPQLPEVKEELITQKAEALMIVHIIIAFIQQDEEKLAKSGVTPRVFREAFEARNQFYEICNANEDIKGLGFDETYEFPVKRSDFTGLQVSLPPKEEIEEQLDWIVGVERIIANSPVWRRNLQDKRHWYGTYGDNKTATFVVDDESFWRRRDDGSLHLQPNDQLKVQWAFIEKHGKRSRFRVLRVLEFNEDHLADELTDDALDAMLGRFEQEEKQQGELLEWKD